jgi:hypothetical protein
MAKKISAIQQTQLNTGYILSQQKIANAQLSALNKTNIDIAASNKRLETLNEGLRDEAKKQSALLEMQAEQAKLDRLEKARQIQLKQGAFSLGKEIERILPFHAFPRYLILQKAESEVQVAKLNADELQEINDKEYTHGVLTRFKETQKATRDELSDEQYHDLETFWRSFNAITEFPERIEKLKKQQQLDKATLEELELRLAKLRTTPLRFGMILLGGFLVLGGFSIALDPKDKAPGVWVIALLGAYLLIFKNRKKAPSKVIAETAEELATTQERFRSQARELEDLHAQLDEARVFLDKCRRSYPETAELLAATPALR